MNLKLLIYIVSAAVNSEKHLPGQEHRHRNMIYRLQKRGVWGRGNDSKDPLDNYALLTDLQHLWHEIYLNTHTCIQFRKISDRFWQYTIKNSIRKSALRRKTA
jgi:hypothetical protein